MSRLICCIPPRKEPIRRIDEDDEEHIPLVDHLKSNYAKYKSSKTSLCHKGSGCDHLGKSVATSKSRHVTSNAFKEQKTLPYCTLKNKTNGFNGTMETPRDQTNRHHSGIRATNTSCLTPNCSMCKPSYRKSRSQKSGYNLKVKKVQPCHFRNVSKPVETFPFEWNSTFHHKGGQIPSVQSGEFEKNNNSIKLDGQTQNLMSTRSWELDQAINLQVVGYSPDIVPRIDITETKYYDVSSKSKVKLGKHSTDAIRELFQTTVEDNVCRVSTKSLSVDKLYAKTVIQAQDVQRPLKCWLGKLRVLHVGVMVTTNDGDKWLVHKAKTNGTMDTTVTDAASMAPNWKVISTRDVHGRTLGDFVKAGGLSYNIITNNCWHARKRMMKLCK